MKSNLWFYIATPLKNLFTNYLKYSYFKVNG